MTYTLHKSFKFNKIKLSESQLIELLEENLTIKLKSSKSLQQLITYDYIKNAPIIVVFDAKNNVIVKVLQYDPDKNKESKTKANEIFKLVDDFINPK